jgi:uncharacterized damage-inducible protein DinB
MAMVDGLLPEFDREMLVTRRMLAAVPFNNPDWKPHAKSKSMRELASHVAGVVRMGLFVLTQSDLETGSTFPRLPDVTSNDELLKRFDEFVTNVRKELIGRGDGEMMVPWSMKRDGKEMFTMPRASAWRTFVISHVIHHRGQLSVYLRLNEVPVPPVYGPTADERF